MLKNATVLMMLMFSAYIAGCATVPMASDKEDVARKEFSAPPQDYAGLYIYRNSSLGGALKKNVYVDGDYIGESAPKTYFYIVVVPGDHVLSTESEFSDNTLELHAESGQNYFIRQYIKLGVFVGGANLELVSEEEGKKGVLECELAQ